jgi:hypothetical protein
VLYARPCGLVVCLEEPQGWWCARPMWPAAPVLGAAGQKPRAGRSVDPCTTHRSGAPDLDRGPRTGRRDLRVHAPRPSARSRSRPPSAPSTATDFDLHTMLRPPTGIFSSQGKKVARPGMPSTERLWVYDLPHTQGSERGVSARGIRCTKRFTWATHGSPHRRLAHQRALYPQAEPTPAGRPGRRRRGIPAWWAEVVS